MLNTKILSAWPNWLIIPAMVGIWIVAAVLGAELVGAAPWHSEKGGGQ
jgi:hypothetical protein